MSLYNYSEEPYTVLVPYNFNQELKDLPEDTQKIIFDEYFDYHGNNNQPSQFNQSVDNLPNSLIVLKFGYNFNQNVNELPNNLKKLTFGYKFNQTVDKLPNSLKKLKFGNSFNQKVDKLPNNLNKLTFGFAFNQPVDKLSNFLTHLKFEWSFNHPIDKLPNSLTHLILGDSFTQSIDNLPKNIKELGFTSGCSVINHIPINIENIRILFYDHSLFDKPIDNIPVHIKQIKISMTEKLHYINKIPFGCKIVDNDNNTINVDEYLKQLDEDQNRRNVELLKLFKFTSNT